MAARENVSIEQAVLGSQVSNQSDGWGPATCPLPPPTPQNSDKPTHYKTAAWVQTHIGIAGGCDKCSVV